MRQGVVADAFGMGWRLAGLWAAFALHNMEEAILFDVWPNIGMAQPVVERATFGLAVAILTSLVAAVFAVAAIKHMQRAWGWSAGVIAGGLLINAAGHAVQSMIAPPPVPGG